jgi:hypothetical protein
VTCANISEFQTAAEAGPAGDGWAWHPVQVEVSRDFRAVLAEWPGDVCGVCWAAWGRDVLGYSECELFWDAETCPYATSDGEPGSEE